DSAALAIVAPSAANVSLDLAALGGAWTGVDLPEAADFFAAEPALVLAATAGSTGTDVLAGSDFRGDAVVLAAVTGLWAPRVAVLPPAAPVAVSPLLPTARSAMAPPLQNAVRGIRRAHVSRVARIRTVGTVHKPATRRLSFCH